MSNKYCGKSNFKKTFPLLSSWMLSDEINVFNLGVFACIST